jgi:DNA-binding SARP family transcriptional activator
MGERNVVSLHTPLGDTGAPPRELTLLGDPAVDGVALGSPTSSTARIVAYVALRGQATRSRVACALWPDATEERAQGSVRTALWRLQRSHPGLIDVGASQVGLSAGLRVDYQEVTRLGHQLLRADTDISPATFADCDGFVRLLSEVELLPGWDEEWAVQEQERFCQLRLHVLEALALRLGAQGAYGLALEAALAAQRANPLRESAYRAVIEVHLAEGNLCEARRQFLACIRMLREDLAVPPSPATLELGERMGADVTSIVARARRLRAG